jgi:hypothetical protein
MITSLFKFKLANDIKCFLDFSSFYVYCIVMIWVFMYSRLLDMMFEDHRYLKP